MKIPNEQELEQTAYNHSSNADFKDFMDLYKKMYCKTIFFFSYDVTIASDNPLHFRKNLLERM